jgi:periplasmic divalent cation tolerance protein
MAGNAASAIIILTTAGDKDAADRLARALVEDGMAACVARFPVRSTYRWQGAVEEAQEWQLMIKTTTAMRDAVEDAVKKIGGYDLPEFVVIDEGVSASAAYLAWMLESCSHDT